MSASPAINGKKGIPLRIFTQILLFLALIGLSALALQPLQRAVNSEISNIRDRIITRAEAAIGRKIQYASIRPNILGAIDIRNLQVLGSDQEPVLSVARFRFSYSLWNLIIKKNRAIRSILVDRPYININLERDRDLIDLLLDLQGKSGSGIENNQALQLPQQAAVKIRGGQWIINNKHDKFRFSGLYTDIKISGDQFTFNGRTTGSVTLADLPVLINSSFNTRINGSFSADSREGSANIIIPFVATDAFRLHPVEFNLKIKETVLTMEKSGDSKQWDFNLDYDFAEGDLSARYMCDNLVITDILSLQGNWKQASSWLDMTNSGEALFKRSSNGSLSYSVDIDGFVSPVTENASFSVHAAGNEKNIEIGNFYILSSASAKNAGDNNLSNGSIEYRGNIGLSPFTPTGTLLLQNLNIWEDEILNAAFNFESQEKTIGIFSDTLDIGDISFAALDGSISYLEDGLGFAFSVLRFRNTESYSNVRLSTINLDALFDYEPRQFSGSLKLDSFSVSDLESIMQSYTKKKILPVFVKNLFNNISVTTEVFFKTDFEHLLYNVPRFVIAVESRTESSSLLPVQGINFGGIRNSVGLLSISGTDQRFELSEGRFIMNGNLFYVSGFADFTNPMDINFSFITNYLDISYYLEGSVLDRRSLSIQGSYGLGVYIGTDGFGSYSGYVEGSRLPIIFSNSVGYLSFFSSMRYNGSDFWTVELDRFELIDASGSAENLIASIAGSADQNSGRLSKIYYSDDKGPLEGNADFSWSWNAANDDNENSERVISGTIFLEGSAEKYYAVAAFSKDLINFSVIGSGMQLSRVSSGLYNAVAEGELQVSWDLGNSFQANLNLDSLHAKIQERDLNIRANAFLDGNVLSIENFKINYADLEGNIPFFTMNLDEGFVKTQAGFQGYAAGRWFEGAFLADTQFRPVESWIYVQDALSLFNGEIQVEKLQYAGITEISPFNIVFSQSNESLSVTGGPMNMLRLHSDMEGNFFAALSNPSVIRGSVTGKISNNTIEAYTGDLYIDLGGLWKFVPPIPEFALAGGYANAQVEIRGPLGDPEFFGSIRGTSVSIQVPPFITRDIRPVPFTALIDGNEIRMVNVPATVGSGGGIVNGWFRFDRWIPNIFQLDIFVPPETPIPFGFDIAGFLTSGDVSGTLIIAMDNMVFDVSGDLLANDAEIGLNSDEIINAQGQDVFADSRYPFVVDINVTAGPAVEFLWPSSNIPILRANPDIGTKVKVTADSLARQYTINSDVNIRRGELFYFERSFYIRSGTLVFRENEIRFEPRLTARAEAQDRNDEGPVTISMIVENAPLFDFTARFESRPSLSQTEIFALLGQNLTGSQIDENTGNIQLAFLSSGADAIAQFIIVRQLERQIRRFTRLDMFSVRTQILQNAFFNVTGLRQTPVDRIAGVGNYFDNTTVFLGKYIGANMFAQTMLALRYDENKTSFGGLSFEWDIGVELQSPFLNIRWDFIPTHPENWWVNDNSITLTWRKTF